MPRFSNFLRNATIHFHMFLYLAACFLRVTVLLLCIFQALSTIHVPIIIPYISCLWRETKLFYCVTGAATKQWLSGNMLLNINTCKNRWSNLSENLRIVASILIELSRFSSPNLSVYFNFVLRVSILHKQQHVFRDKESITQAIFHFLQYLYKRIDSGNIVLSLFLDFRKAFDCLTTRFCYQS